MGIASDIAKDLWPNSFITRGSELVTEFREYERGTTAAINAAIKPVLHNYIQRLQQQLKEDKYLKLGFYTLHNITKHYII